MWLRQQHLQTVGQKAIVLLNLIVYNRPFLDMIILQSLILKIILAVIHFTVMLHERIRDEEFTRIPDDDFSLAQHSVVNITLLKHGCK